MQPGFLGRLCDADMITYYIDSLYINVNLDKVVWCNYQLFIV